MPHNFTRVLQIAIGLLTLICSSASGQSLWSGYINDKTFDDKTYGYLFTGSASSADRKLRLVCYAPDTYTFYLRTDHSADDRTATVRFVVDSLPAVTVEVQHNSDGISMSNQSEQFWPLIAQMVAGAKLRIHLPDETSPVQFNLSGFTDAYTGMCGWIKTSSQYTSHLALYR